jgi:hypothetical protein
MTALNYLRRDNILDLYDLVFCVEEFFKTLPESTLSLVREVLALKHRNNIDLLLSNTDHSEQCNYIDVEKFNSRNKFVCDYLRIV